MHSLLPQTTPEVEEEFRNPTSGHRYVDAVVKFFYIPKWPLPGWYQANPGLGTYRTNVEPAFWKSGVGTSHAIHVEWDDTGVSGHAEANGEREDLLTLPRSDWR